MSQPEGLLFAVALTEVLERKGIITHEELNEQIGMTVADAI